MVRDLNRRRSVLASIACLFLVLLSSQLLPAQQNAASITGTILDASGKALPGAVVTAKNESTPAAVNAKTDATGRFSITGLSAGSYRVEASAPGFATVSRDGQQLAPGATQDISVTLTLANFNQVVTVEGDPTSVAAQLAPIQASLEQHSPHSVITDQYIDNFTSPVSDFTSILQIVPGTFSVSPNGVGLGQSNTYFRGFADGQYTMTFDGIPFEDTNSPTHHSWAFFPSEWIGGVDFDRSPGTASTIGPTNFGGSISLLSRQEGATPDFRASVSYGSWSTRLYDFGFDTGQFGPGNRSSLLLDVHQLESSGYQTFNKQKRDAGSLKYQFKINDKTTLTIFGGLIDLWTNTPNFNGPTRAQVALYGDNFLLSGDPTSPTYYGINYYHVQTDFEYIGLKTELGRGWKLDFKPYTYRYWNKQNYNSTTTISTTSAVDKLNGYRKIGDIISVSKDSRWGTFRTGAWYEWAYTDRYQYPTDPRSGIDTKLPNFHEHFITQSVQPFAEYVVKATSKLTITAGLKFAYYNMHLNQFADNGKTVGNLSGNAFVTHAAGYNSWLPAVDGNYRITNNWSAYAQFATGSVIPPSSVFDVKNALVETVPKPTNVRTYQVGTVWKNNRVALDFDAYYSHFQNPYSTTIDPASGEPVYILTGDSITKGMEAEGNLYIARGFSLYLNGTAGNAKYAGIEQWVQNAPRNTEAVGVTYQQKNWDFGFFDKRIGQMYNDNGVAHQAVSINPFSVANLYVNYTIRNASYLRDSKFRLSVNNLFDNRSIVGVTPGSTTTSIASPNDILTLIAGRSVMLSFTVGYAPRR